MNTKSCKCGANMIMCSKNYNSYYGKTSETQEEFPQRWWCGGCNYTEPAPPIIVKTMSEQQVKQEQMTLWRLANLQL